MCLNEKYTLINNIILYSSIILGFLCLIIFIIKKSHKKRKIKKIVIVFIILLLINICRIFLLKNCIDNNSKGNDTNMEENIKSSSITTKNSTTTTSTTSTTKTTTTKSKPVNQNEYIETTSKGFEIRYINGAYYIDNHIIANKSYLLDQNFVPTDTHKKITASMDGFCKECINNEAYESWLKMKNDASALGLNLWIQSGYRSYDYQKDLYNGYVKRDGKTAADKYSARPGASEHQTALAFDLNTITSSFANTNEGKWVDDNAYLYGYIIRYPNGKNDITGYKYEPWHIRYVGLSLAKELYNNGSWLTMEEYFGIDSKYEE